MTQNTLPSFTVIIEWENARLSELARARAMLTSLAEQIAEISATLDTPPELLVLYDPAAIDSLRIKAMLDDAFVRSTGIERHLIPCAKGTYYRQKNHGATRANRGLIMFLDSDVVPEPDWLKNLLGSFADPSIAIACGNTYIDTTSLYAKAFALFWFFPLRAKEANLTPSTHFFANNVVFRRDVFLRYGFPELPYLRGQCTALAANLTKDGVPIHIQNAARVSHPPPNGISHFLKRALCEGHDQLHQARTRGERGLRGSFGRYRRFISEKTRRIWTNRRDVDLSRAGAVASTGLAVTYASLCLTGELVTAIHPSFVRDRLAV